MMNEERARAIIIDKDTSTAKDFEKRDFFLDQYLAPTVIM
jgi:hypothetical protein